MATATSAQAAPAFKASGLNAAVTGTSVTATTTVTAATPTTATNAGVCARSSTNDNVDFPKKENVPLSASPTTLTVVRTFLPGTYTYWTCVNASGRWYDVGTKKTFTVSSTTSTTSPAPTTVLPAGSVTPRLETPTLPGSGDVADDPAIWVDPQDASRSLVFGTSKAESGGGLAVYDLAGQQLQFRADGKLNNVDLRSDVLLAGSPTVVLAATNRTNWTLAFYRLNTATRQVEPVSARSISTGFEPYGVTMYRSKTTGRHYAFVSEENGSRVTQYELRDSGGKVDAALVRTLTVGSLTEGMVADDDLGNLYVAEEDRGIWRYGAEPGAGTTRTAIGTVGDGHLTADVEGLALARRPDGTGHLIASSQGDSSFTLYDRITGAWVKSFTIGATDTVDGVGETDGIDVTTSSLGAAFPDGLLVVHDAVNTGGTTSNYKYVDLAQVLGTTNSPAPVETVLSPNPVGVPGAWTLAFDDEFDGGTVNTATWNVHNGKVMNNVPTSAANVSQSGGQLLLQLSNTDGTVRGGMVSSSQLDGSGRFGFEAGIGTYTESRVHFPGDDAQPIYNWPAAWTSGHQWPTNGEHDYAEGLSGRLTANYHYQDSYGSHVANNSGPISGVWNNNFHTYGVHRKATSADVYWDGRLVRTYATSDGGGGHSLIFNVGRSNTRTPVLGTAGAVRVDYVRVWKP